MHIDSLEQWKHEHDFNIDTSQGERRTRLVVVLTACMMVVEITAGYLYGSMALLADGWHMGTHVAALAISLFAYRYARQHADNPVYSFGTGKVSALGGYASAVALAVVAVLMGMESVHRLLFPETIHFDQAILVASIGLVVNLLSAWLLHGGAAHRHHHNDAAHDHHHHHDHNLRAAYLHVIGDTMRCARRGRTRRGLVVGPNGFCNAMSFMTGFRVLGFSSRIGIILILSLLLSNRLSAQPVAAQGQLTQSPSIVEIPVRISLDRLFEVAEQQMPLQAGNWRDWQKTYGIKTKYRAWRGPLYFTMQGELLLVQAHVRYWIKAQKKVLGALNLKSSCGVNEPPRQAVIGVQIRLGWGPDWMLRPGFRVVPSRFLDRCEMTIADIDVTPLIAKEFQKQLKEKMRTALMTLDPRLNAIRQQAEQSWFLLQEPVQLWADNWLLLNPMGIALSPLAGHGDRVDAHLAVLMVPKMVTGSEPAPQQRPLPPLLRFYPRSTGLNLRLAVELNYADLNRAMTEQLSGASIDIGGHQAGIEALELGGQGQEIRVNAKLSGDAAGTVMIKANMIFTAEKQQFQLENLEYSYTPEDPLLEPQASLFYGYIRKVLEAAANQQLQQRMNQWKEQLLTVFDKITPKYARLDLTSLQLRQVRLSMAEDAVRLNGLASGHIMLDFR